MRPTASFLAWWEVEGKEPVATYIVDGGELNHSMVTEATLKREGIAVPEIKGSNSEGKKLGGHYGRGSTEIGRNNQG